MSTATLQWIMIGISWVANAVAIVSMISTQRTLRRMRSKGYL